MTYQIAADLQSAIFERLAADATVTSIFATNIFDTPPERELPNLFLTIGTEDVVARDDKTAKGAEHRLTFTVVAREAGFHRAKSAAAAVEACLTGAAPWQLGRGRLVSFRFFRARARREQAGAIRRIDLLFRARVDHTD